MDEYEPSEFDRREVNLLHGLIAVLAILAVCTLLLAACKAAMAGEAALSDRERVERLEDAGYHRVADRKPSYTRLVASAYGPGLFGNTMYCKPYPVLHASTIAIASKTYPCGTVLEVCTPRRCTRGVVKDRGPFVAGRDLDLSTALVRRLGIPGATERQVANTWGVRTVRARCIASC